MPPPAPPPGADFPADVWDMYSKMLDCLLLSSVVLRVPSSKHGRFGAAALLDDAAAAGVLRSMATAARLGGVVSDLVRSRTGLVLAILGTTLLARSRVARVDGPLSVRAARTPREYRILADRAGLPQAVVRRAWPERVVLEWRSAEAVADLVPGVACA